MINDNLFIEFFKWDSKFIFRSISNMFESLFIFLNLWEDLID